MKEDIFDVVDSFDRVVSSAPRSQVHSQRLFHRASHILIFSDASPNRKILLQKRSAQKDSYPNIYTTSCSGHVDSGETYDIAAVREMFEETGLKVDISQLRYVGKISPSAETENEFTAVYEYFSSEDSPYIVRPEEVASLDWVKECDFQKMIEVSPKLFTPSFLKVYKFYLSERQK